ncbi:MULTISPECIES: type III secretion system translocon subunit SctE [Bradyrhizobium]|uniref:type III secretion system translocon subunit SctE n=1 Tax=Bradyrhizobium TaxID=374 RepID=UPI0012FE0F38|nr:MULTISPECIES: type III secretion system translocon subunit SctE [Bradyrhizobium]MBR0892403.1 type III secretion system translocon subunit SctE [Bradyrhizobium diazoefficiens]MBR0924391.1 type III secretion system translocon subunit SctE [Bradyrhizobium diazoefficiens]UQE03710.1 type III secretion system translocon subunit SctE [Bradyrhizobium japonicum]UQE03755.1 type III secretion system translocon subunit SctE [Bradyrhizobium japonicum]WLB24624.1 type III secretion system translocon subun
MNVTAWTSETQYEAGALLVPGRSLIARSGALDTTAIGNLPPAVSGKIVASGSIPSLAVPRALDPIELANNLLAVRVKMADRLIASGMADVRHEGELLRQQHEMIGNKIIEAANAMAKAKKSSRIMKFLGWLAVGLSIAAAVVNPGIVATVAAAVTVGVAVLNETGVVDKMTQAIAKRLMKDGDMDAAQANKVAIGITMGIILSVTVLTAGAGLMGGCGNGASAAASAAAMWSRLGESGATVLRGLASLAKQSGSLPTVLARAMNQAASTIVDTTSNATRIAQISQRVSIAARVGEAVASFGEAAAGIANGVQQKEAADTQADALDIRKRITWMKELQRNEMDFIKQLVLDQKATTQRIAEAIESRSASDASLIRAFA